MASPAGLPADVLASIAKQRSKKGSPTMTAPEIAQHRFGQHPVPTLGSVASGSATRVAR